MTTNPTTKKTPPAILEWLIWSAVATGLVVIYLTLGQRPAQPSAHATPPAFAFIGLIPLALGTALRWAIMPNLTDVQKRLPFFIVGVIMAEACGVLGIFLGGPHKDTLFTLSLLGLAQFFPGFLPPLLSPPPVTPPR